MPRVGRSFSGSQSACSGCNLEFLLRVIPGNSSFLFYSGELRYVTQFLELWRQHHAMPLYCYDPDFYDLGQASACQQSSVYWLWTTLACPVTGR